MVPEIYQSADLIHCSFLGKEQSWNRSLPGKMSRRLALRLSRGHSRALVASTVILLEHY
jgi:hypothetical protein